MDIHQELDTCGLRCPHPILRTKKALSVMSSGQILHVLSTDPTTCRDFQDFARQTGNEILATDEHDGVFEFFIRRR